MRNISLIFSSFFLLSTSAIAMDLSEQPSEMMVNTKNKHNLYIGTSKISGHISNLSDNSAFSFGYDYTLDNNVIIGAYYMPELVSRSVSFAGVRTEIESRDFGIYSGYHFDNNFRLTAGLNFTNSKSSINSRTLAISDDNSEVGFNFGIDYQINHFLIGGRFATHDVGGFDGNTITLNIGVSF